MKEAFKTILWNSFSALIVISAFFAYDQLVASKLDRDYVTTRRAAGEVASQLCLQKSLCGNFPETVDVADSCDACRSDKRCSQPVNSALDAWARAFDYQAQEGYFRLRSLGKDGIRGTQAVNDDLLFQFDCR